MSEYTPSNSPPKLLNSVAKFGSPENPTATTRQADSVAESASHHKKLYVSIKTETNTPLKTTKKEKGSRQKSSPVAFESSVSSSSQKRGNDSQTMDTHISPKAENSTGPWLCLKCSVCLPSHEDYRLHLIDIHNETINPRICEHCGWKFENKRELHFHMYTDHQIKSLLFTFPECDLCDRKYSSKDELESHMTECLEAHISAIKESDHDTEDDGSIIYDIILVSEDDDDDDMPLQQPARSRQNQLATPQQTQVKQESASDSDADVDAPLVEDGHRDNIRIKQEDEQCGTGECYSLASPEDNEAMVWKVINVSGILKQSGDEGKLLLSQVNKTKLTRPQKRTLSKMIVDYFISRKINMTLQQSYALERDVVRLFPGEKLEDWRSKEKGPGTLYNSFRYKRRAAHAKEKYGEKRL